MDVITKTPNIEAVGPYSLMVPANGFLFLSGQIGVSPDKKLVEGGTLAQFKQAVSNVKEVLTTAGVPFTNIVRVVVYLADMNDYPALNQEYARQFASPFPVRTTVQVAKLPLGAMLELEVTARAV